MRKLQQELNLEDSTWQVARTIEQLSAETLDFTLQPPLPRRARIKVQCLECSHKFSTSSAIPECTNCGGSDVDLA
jgi:rRNA maturation endonuclease Nob1